MTEEKFQYLKKKYNLPDVIDEENVNGKVVDYTVEGSDYYIIVFKDNTCLVLHSPNDNMIQAKYSDCIDEEWFIENLMDHFKDCYEEMTRETRKANEKILKEARYKSYLQLKEEFEGQ